MILEVRLPEISENVTSGDVVKILVAVGDAVKVEQSLIELETEKAVFEVPATAAGTVAEILVAAGDTVNVGQALLKIDTAATAATTSAPEKKKEATPVAPAPAPEPKPSRPAAAEEADETERVGDAVVAVAQEAVPPAPSRTGPAPASPTVRRLARELGVNIDKVAGTGPGGRIAAADVQNYAKSVISGAAKSTAIHAAPSVAVDAKALPDFTRFGTVERQAMSKIRHVTALNLSRAWNTVPAVTQNDEADITELEAARKRYGAMAEAAGGKLTMTSILLKVCASALRRFPDFNASIDLASREIVLKKYVNIGVAVDTDRGLLVPVIRDADKKNIVALSAELAGMAAKARDKKIKPDDMEGGNFTISNLGGIGGTGFSPIVNSPEVAILGVSRAKMQPVFKDEGFVPRLIMPLSLSYDHRLIDGAAAARFLRYVCEALEDPILIALDG